MSVKFSHDDAVRNRLFRVITSHCKRHGLAHTQMARLLGISGPALSQYLNGHIPINTDLLLRCAMETGTQPAELSPVLRGFALAPESLAA